MVCDGCGDKLKSNWYRYGTFKYCNQCAIGMIREGDRVLEFHIKPGEEVV